MHHRRVKGLLFFSDRRYIDAARGLQFFSRPGNQATADARVLFIGTPKLIVADFSPEDEAARSTKQRRGTGTKTKRKRGEERAASSRFEPLGNAPRRHGAPLWSVERVSTIGRVGEPAPLFVPLYSRRIVSDSRDLYLPPGPTTFSPDWAHCPWRRS